MAFTRDSLSRVGTGSTGAAAVWSYATDDTLVDVDVVGYFDDNKPAMRDGDIVMVNSSIDGVGLFSVRFTDDSVNANSVLPNSSTVQHIKRFEDFVSDEDFVYLQPNTIYLFSSFINIGNRVFADPGGPIEMFGYNANISGIVSTDTTRALLTLSGGGSFDSLSFITGGTFISAAGTFGGPGLTFDRLNIDAPDPGDIGDYTAVLVDRVRLRNQTQPLDFTGQYLRVTLNVLTAVNVGPGATICRFTNTVDVDERLFITGCFFTVAAGQTALEFDPGITIGSERIVNTNNSYEGAGTYIAGLAQDDNRFFTLSNTNLTDTRAVGGWTMTNNATPTVLTQGVPTKIAGTTAGLTLQIRFTPNGFNRLDYTGDKARVLLTQGSLTVTTASNNQVLALYQAVNGVPGTQPIARVSTTGSGSARVDGFAISAATILNDGDFIELFIENETSSDNPTVTDGFLILAEA